MLVDSIRDEVGDSLLVRLVSSLEHVLELLHHKIVAVKEVNGEGARVVGIAAFLRESLELYQALQTEGCISAEFADVLRNRIDRTVDVCVDSLKEIVVLREVASFYVPVVSVCAKVQRGDVRLEYPEIIR